MRITVLGAGIVGVHGALELPRRGAQVTLIDAGEPGGGTTAGSFAWIDASAPGVADYLELRVLGVRAGRRRAEELGWPRWLSLPGTTTWASSPGEIEAHAELLLELGQRVDRVDRRTALRDEPDLVVPPAVETVWRFAGEGWAQTAPAVGELVARCR